MTPQVVTFRGLRGDGSFQVCTLLVCRETKTFVSPKRFRTFFSISQRRMTDLPAIKQRRIP